MIIHILLTIVIMVQELLVMGIRMVVCNVDALNVIQVAIIVKFPVGLVLALNVKLTGTDIRIHHFVHVWMDIIKIQI